MDVTQTRSFCYVDDAVDQVKFVMEHNSDDMIYNIYDGTIIRDKNFGRKDVFCM